MIRFDAGKVPGGWVSAGVLPFTSLRMWRVPEPAECPAVSSNLRKCNIWGLFEVRETKQGSKPVVHHMAWRPDVPVRNRCAHQFANGLGMPRRRKICV